jgi:hypothetical protein
VKEHAGASDGGAGEERPARQRLLFHENLSLMLDDEANAVC